MASAGHRGWLAGAAAAGAEAVVVATPERVVTGSVVRAIYLLLPCAALGEVQSEYVSEANGKLATNRYRFAGETPPAVAQVLGAHGWQMDLHGTYGYIRQEEAVCAASFSALPRR